MFSILKNLETTFQQFYFLNVRITSSITYELREYKPHQAQRPAYPIRQIHSEVQVLSTHYTAAGHNIWIAL